MAWKIMSQPTTLPHFPPLSLKSFGVVGIIIVVPFLPSLGARSRRPLAQVGRVYQMCPATMENSLFFFDSFLACYMGDDKELGTVDFQVRDAGMDSFRSPLRLLHCFILLEHATLSLPCVPAFHLTTPFAPRARQTVDWDGGVVGVEQDVRRGH